MSLFRVSVAVAVVALASPAAVADPMFAPCKVADADLSMAGKLDRAAKRLKDADDFRILVVGSSSTAGVGATSPSKAYTARLETELEQRLAGVDVSVVARGIGGETAVGAEARLKTEIGAAKPDLVIWQIGTNDVYRKIDVAAFRSIAERGIADITAAGVDVALLDPQYVPQDEALYTPYIGVLKQISAATGVPIARRYDAMKSIAKSGGAAMISGDRLHMNDTGHACVGAFLAEALDRKIAPLPPAMVEAHRPT
ncbi:SGNH/GDSL hydrolase family protein [Methylopila sp. M107]|uniref:SGNH/GDSL hydrolase family protein n=1 Tax=Methylopila sp. M107 TaxID=1101190 RepID=UPI001FDA1AF5|nr:SGNH/GDSL hydrolase family protein [Methylopila sp. M107]